jgi:hypothetical protein
MNFTADEIASYTGSIVSNTYVQGVAGINLSALTNVLEKRLHPPSETENIPKEAPAWLAPARPPTRYLVHLRQGCELTPRTGGL